MKNPNPGASLKSLLNSAEEGWTSLLEKFREIAAEGKEPDERVFGPKELRAVQQIFERQRAIIQRYEKPDQIVAIVVWIQREEGKEPTAIIYTNGRFMGVEPPKEMVLRPGNMVLASSKTHQIISLLSLKPIGEIGVVNRIIDGERLEIGMGNATAVAVNGLLNTKPEIGDQVLLDNSRSVVLENYGKADEQFRLNDDINVAWADIGGADTAKRALIEALELPYKYAALYERYNQKPPKGILLYGPPGCGKTLLVKAAANSLARTHGRNSVPTGFIYIKGPQILDKFVGVAEAKIRRIFQTAKEHEKRYGYPAVICIEEAESILNQRGTGQSSDVERTIVPAFLAEMDGVETSKALVILTTNRVELLDEAVVREGRIDRKIKIDRPTKAGAEEIFKIHLKKVPLKDITVEEMARYGAEEIFSPAHALYEVTRKGGEKLLFTLAHIVSGALIAGVVEKASSLALRRDRELSESQSQSQTIGITKTDISSAVSETLEENRDVNHKTAIADFAKDFSGEIIDVKKLAQTKK